MALTLETNVRNAMADAIDATVNAGAGTATFKFETAADAEVANFDLNNPAFDTAGAAGGNAAGQITLEGTPKQDTTAAGGTIEHFSIYDRNAAKVMEGTVQTTGGDVTITSLSVTANDTVELTSFSITVPA